MKRRDTYKCIYVLQSFFMACRSVQHGHAHSKWSVLLFIFVFYQANRGPSACKQVICGNLPWHLGIPLPTSIDISIHTHLCIYSFVRCC